MSHIDTTLLGLFIHPHVLPTHSPNNISFPSAKSNISLGMLFLLTGSHCPHVRVHVPDPELNTGYLYWELEFRKFFHLGDSPSRDLQKRCVREEIL